MHRWRRHGLLRLYVAAPLYLRSHAIRSRKGVYAPENPPLPQITGPVIYWAVVNR